MVTAANSQTTPGSEQRQHAGQALSAGSRFVSSSPSRRPSAGRWGRVSPSLGASQRLASRLPRRELLCERREPGVVPALRKLAAESKSDLGRFHALYVLASLEALTPPDLVRHSAIPVRMSADMPSVSPRVFFEPATRPWPSRSLSWGVTRTGSSGCRLPFPWVNQRMKRVGQDCYASCVIGIEIQTGRLRRHGVGSGSALGAGRVAEFVGGGSGRTIF
jgi:hypothetical protein